jgi:hypothetical protein
MAFSKKEACLNSSQASRSWIESIGEYKGASTVSEQEAQRIMNTFNKYYKDYQKCGKS